VGIRVVKLSKRIPNPLLRLLPTTGAGFSLAVIPALDIFDAPEKGSTEPAELIRHAIRPNEKEARGRPPAQLERESIETIQSREVDDWIIEDLGLALAWIAPGEFLMGSPASEEGRDEDETQHHVTITQGYWIGKTEVTYNQWDTIVGLDSKHPTTFSKDAPIEFVSWHDASDFCLILTSREQTSGRLPAGYRYALPTESQWEHASRAGTSSPFFHGDRLSSGEANFDGNFPYGGAPKGRFLEKPTTVGQYAPDRSGIFDTQGNLWEWCRDWYGRYNGNSVVDPRGPDHGKEKVIRGGSWFDNSRYCRAAMRMRTVPSNRRDNIGFRVALTPIGKGDY